MQIIDISLASSHENHEFPLSGEELREFPLFLQRVSFFPDVPEHKAIIIFPNSLLL